MPGVGPITTLAVKTLAAPREEFRRERNFAAWLGLVPRQHSTGGKPRLWKTIEDGSARYAAHSSDRTHKPDKSTHSITCSKFRNSSQTRTASTRECWTPVLLPPPATHHICLLRHVRSVTPRDVGAIANVFQVRRPRERTRSQSGIVGLRRLDGLVRRTRPRCRGVPGHGGRASAAPSSVYQRRAEPSAWHRPVRVAQSR